MLLFDGILLCDKPSGMTSHDVVDKIRRITGQKKAGHTGTLDPQATGLLMICLGRATKISRFFSDLDKTYDAVIRLGIVSKTYDAEGITADTESSPVPELANDDIEAILRQFEGKIKQRVPAYSAAQKGGKRLYKMARRGEEVETPIREVEIHNIELLDYKKPDIHCRVTCSKGTYIRTLAHDIGGAIGCGGYLAKLNRTRIGSFELNSALTIDDMKNHIENDTLSHIIVSIDKALNYPSVSVDEKFIEHVVDGRLPQYKDIVSIEGKFAAEDVILLRSREGRALAVGKAELDSESIKKSTGANFFSYIRVLN